jgi:hypothetical protein
MTIKAPATFPGNVICELGTTDFGTCAAGAAQWTTSGSDIYRATGKVSIGTSGLTRALTVGVGSTASSANQVQVQGYQASFEVMDHTSTHNYYFGVDDADSSKLKIGGGYSPGQGGVASITIGAGPVVAIGPPASGGTLSVNSNDDFGQSDWVLWTRRESASGVGYTGYGSVSNLSRFQHFSGSNYPEAVLTGIVARGTVGSPAAVQSGDNLFILDGRGYDGSSVDHGEYTLGWSDGQAAVKIQTTENWTGSAHGAQILFQTTPNGSLGVQDSMVVGSSGTVINTGDAGAADALVVSGGRTAYYGGGVLFKNSYWNAGDYGMAAIRGIDSAAQGGSLAFLTTTNSSGPSGTPTEKMRITNDGLVGIGTNSPAGRLHTQGGHVVIGPYSTSTAASLQFREGSSNGTDSISLKAPDAISSSVTFVLPDADGTNGQVLQTNGSGAWSWKTVGGALTSLTVTGVAGSNLQSWLSSPSGYGSYLELGPGSTPVELVGSSGGDFSQGFYGGASGVFQSVRSGAVANTLVLNSGVAAVTALSIGALTGCLQAISGAVSTTATCITTAGGQSIGGSLSLSGTSSAADFNSSGDYLSNVTGTGWVLHTSNNSFSIQGNGVLNTIGQISTSDQIVSSNTATSFLGSGSMSLAGNANLTGGSSAYQIAGTTVIGASRDAHFASAQISATTGTGTQLLYIANGGTGKGIIDLSPYGSMFAGLSVGPYPFELMDGAHFYSSGGTSPTVSGSCSLGSGSTDVKGWITCTGGSSTNLTFGTTYIGVPVCVGVNTDTTSSPIVSVSASVIQFVFSVTPSHLGYICIL